MSELTTEAERPSSSCRGVLKRGRNTVSVDGASLALERLALARNVVKSRDLIATSPEEPHE